MNAILRPYPVDALDQTPVVESPRLRACGDGWLVEPSAAYSNAIENAIGTVRVPVGLAGPLRVHGRFARGDYPLPLATTEASLVASYHRGAAVISEAGGCNVALLEERVSRSPGFVFENLSQALRFTDWASAQTETWCRTAADTGRYVQLIHVNPIVEGNHVYLVLGFTTGEAAGQNMVTLATEAICRHIDAQAPTKPRRSYIEANYCGDKKPCAASFTSVRGKRVTAEVVIPADVMRRRLRVTPQQLVDCWRMGAIGGALSGAVGIQAQFANGLAALFIACGQDVACVAESAVGVCRAELTDEGDFYGAVTLPNVMVGTVGGGTGLPDQRRNLDLMGLSGPDSARALAEICAGLCMAGELSLCAALCSGDFARAHRALARGRAARGRAQSNGSATETPEHPQERLR